MKSMKPPFDQSSSVGRGVGVLISRTRALSSSVTRWSRSANSERPDADVAVLPSSGPPLRSSSYRIKPPPRPKVRFASGRLELMGLIENRKLRNVRESKIADLVERENYLSDIEFDNKNFSLDELQVAAVLILERAAPNAAFADKAGLMSLFDFVDSVRAVYKPNPYHDFRHAVDVMQFMNYLLTREDVAQRILAPNQGFTASGDELRFMMLVACICHDAGHDGTSNLFQRKANTEIFEKFGPESTLERLHAWHAEHLIESSDILEAIKPGAVMDPTQFHQEVRSLIMATDMEKHTTLLATFKASPSAQLLNMLIKISDISNVMRNFDEAKVWAKRLEAEMKLAASRLPPSDSPQSPQVPLAQSVMGFSKMFALPLVDALAEAGLHETSRELHARVTSNIENWERFSGDSLNPGL